MSTIINLEVGKEKQEVEINYFYCIGYAGRDAEKTIEHIKELAEIGIPEPSEIPTLYPLGLSTLTQAKELEVLGNKTSGEAEIVLIFGDTTDEIYLTIGSDHTDRELEAVDINKSKQVCDKPIAEKAWRLEDVVDHWDDLELLSEVYVDNKWKRYQRDKITAILSFEDIKKFLVKNEVPLANALFLSGTVPLLEGFIYGQKFRMKFIDPIKNDEIVAEYDINDLTRSV